MTACTLRSADASVREMFICFVFQLLAPISNNLCHICGRDCSFVLPDSGCLGSHTYAGHHVHQKSHNDGGTGTEFAGDGLGAEARAAGHGFVFQLKSDIDHDGAMDADVLDRYDDAVAIAVEKHSASILSDGRSEENTEMPRRLPHVEDVVIPRL